MESETLNDERRIYVAVQKLIDVMLEFDEETRARMLKTVITFFGLEKSLSFETTARQLPSSKDRVPAFANREDLSPKDFLFQKKTTNRCPPRCMSSVLPYTLQKHCTF